MYVYPSEPGYWYPVGESSRWNTLKTDFESGKEQRRQMWAFPKRPVTLRYDVLQQAEIDTLYNFYNARKGGLEPFWFFDLLSRTLTGEYVGRGDGSQVIFEMPGKSVSSPITGSDMAVNGDFETDPTVDWSVTNGTIAGIAGGASGNCLELTTVSGSGQYAYQTPALEVGKQYRLGVYVKSGSSGDEAFSIGMANNAFTAWVSRVQGATSGTWTYYETTFTATETNSHINLQKDTATAGTMLFDKVTLYEATGNTLKAYTSGAQAGGVLLSGGGDAGVDRFQFDLAPALGSLITADFTGTLRRQMVFDEDNMSYDRFEYALYRSGLRLREVR